MSLHHLERDASTYGTFPGPFGSAVRARGINNSDPHALFSEEGVPHLRAVLAEQAPYTTVGSSPTFRITNLRANDGKNNEWDVNGRRQPEFDPRMGAHNATAVRIAREAHGTGKRIIGLLAPFSDTSGGDDAKWQQLTSDQRHELILRRQTPQIEALRVAGIKHFQVEAGRYVEEAAALAAAVANSGGEGLAFCFEAEDGVVPDPTSNLTFGQVRNEMYEASRGTLLTQVGINCVGAKAARRAVEGGGIQIAYPNELDKGRDPTPGKKLWHEYLALSHNTSRSEEEDRRLLELHKILATPLEEMEELWNVCLDARVQAISVCCGGTTNHVQRAHTVWQRNTTPDDVQPELLVK